MALNVLILQKPVKPLAFHLALWIVSSTMMIGVTVVLKVIVVVMCTSNVRQNMVDVLVQVAKSREMIALLLLHLWLNAGWKFVKNNCKTQ
jgi:hypothetical protein